MSDKIIDIKLLDVIRILKADKAKLAIYAVVAAVLGLILAFATPKTYTSEVILAPEESGSGFSGSISSLASMVGMNMKLGQTGDAIYPEIYPDLMSSTDFIVDLFDVKVVTDKTSEKYTYYEYLLKHQKNAFYQYPKIWLIELVKKIQDNGVKRAAGEKVNPFRLTREEHEIVKAISGLTSCSVDKKTDVITITVKDQDPLIAATIADSIKQHLQTKITDYRTKKARVDLDYMNKLYEEARAQYVKARQVYAAYADANQELNLQAYKMKEEDLENDMQLKYNIYTTVVEQLQLAKSKVQERTPAFTVVQSATVPVKHNNMSKVMVLILSMLAGLFVRVCVIGYKNRNQFIAL